LTPYSCLTLSVVVFSKIRYTSEKVLTFSEDTVNLSYETQVVNKASEASSAGENDILIGPQASGENHFSSNGAGILAG
jgi:hypothetical protein